MLPKSLTFILPDSDREWVLAGTAKDSSQHLPFPSCIKNPWDDLSHEDSFFFLHYSFFIEALRHTPDLISKPNVVLYTHKKDIGLPEKEIASRLNQCGAVFFMTENDRQRLCRKGLSPNKAELVICGADPTKFTPPNSHDSRNAVGFCLGFRDHQHYRDRKNYPLVRTLIKELSQKHPVILLGKNFNQYEHFHELRKLDNFQYIDTTYDHYPSIYQQMAVLVSVSKLEGGPFPLLESMMCNTVPVFSETGYAPHIISQGENGFLFPTESSKDTIIPLIEKALTLPTTKHIRESVSAYSWENFAQKILFAFSRNQL